MNVPECKKNDVFAKSVELIMNIAGYYYFTPAPSDLINSTNDDSEIFYYMSTSNNDFRCEGTGKYAEGKFWLLKGSRISEQVKDYGNMCITNLIKRRRDEQQENIDENGILRKDIPFDAPSGALNFLTGQNKNGRSDWKNAANISLGVCQGDGAGR